MTKVEMRKDTISIVVPVYNESDAIGETARRLIAVRDGIADTADVEIIFVNDGSVDESLWLLKEMAGRHSFIRVLSFSRNFGHQLAITAGIDYSSGDYVAVIDADLQDPPELIPEMYRMAAKGYDVVYGKRRHRRGESLFKKITAAAFYRIINYMCEIDIPKDTGDFRLISRRVVLAFKQLRERNRFVRGMIPWLGFKAIPLEYDRASRFAGETKYPLKKMVVFATTAILSFSRKPLTLAVRVGFVTILVGLILSIYWLYQRLFTNTPIPGFTATLLCIIFFSGVQILLIGVVGEYIARIFEEVQRRPLYVVADAINLPDATVNTQG